MFCRHCGKEIDDKAVVCIHCGLQVEPLAAAQQQKPAVKYCRNCGNQLHYDAVICVKCGVAVEQNVNKEPKKKINVFGLTGFILSICSIWFGIFFAVVPITGLAFSIVGMTKNKKCRLNGFSIAGLTLSIIFTIIWLAVLIGIFASSCNPPYVYDYPYNPPRIDFYV